MPLMLSLPSNTIRLRQWALVLGTGGVLAAPGSARQRALAPVAPAALAHAPASSPVETHNQSLDLLYEAEQSSFWAVEPQFNNYTNNFFKLPPLAPGDANVAGYQGALTAARAFMRAQKAAGQIDERTPQALYLAAMSTVRLCRQSATDRQLAEYFVNRLLTEFPYFKWQRLVGHPETALPCRADLLHLKLWLGSKGHAPRTLNALEDWTAMAAESMLSANRPATEEVGDLLYAAPSPDQLRAAAVPEVPLLVARVHDAALPGLIKSSGAKAVRDYLRSMQKGPFATYANWKLPELDRAILLGYSTSAGQALGAHRYDEAKGWYHRIIDEYSGTEEAQEATVNLRTATIAGYNWSAEQAVAANNYDDAKKFYRQIVAEFPDSDEAAAATQQLTKLVPVAVSYYKAQGAVNWRKGQPGQFMVPQTQAQVYYEKMYEEDPDGPQADYALFWWSRGVGTEGKPDQAIKQYELLMQKWPNSPLYPDAMFCKAFILGANFNRKYDEAVDLMMKMAHEYPNSSWAPDAYWYSAFWRAPRPKTLQRGNHFVAGYAFGLSRLLSQQIRR